MKVGGCVPSVENGVIFLKAFEKDFEKISTHHYVTEPSQHGNFFIFPLKRILTRFLSMLKKDDYSTMFTFDFRGSKRRMLRKG